MSSKQARQRLVLQALVASAYLDSNNPRVRRRAIRAYGNARQGLRVLRTSPDQWQEVLDEYCK